MSRYVLPLLVAVTFLTDIYTTSIGHALTWMLGVVTGLTVASFMRDDDDELEHPVAQRTGGG